MILVDYIELLLTLIILEGTTKNLKSKKIRWAVQEETSFYHA